MTAQLARKLAELLYIFKKGDLRYVIMGVHPLYLKKKHEIVIAGMPLFSH